jgi:hypothetical protein
MGMGEREAKFSLPAIELFDPHSGEQGRASAKSGGRALTCIFVV